MANRSYLYTYNPDVKQPYQDLSEWKTHIPLIHLLLVGFETQTCSSALWDVPYHLAIRGKAEPARELLQRFLAWIATQIIFEDDDCKTRFEREYERTLTLLFQVDRQSAFYHLEIGEILELIGDPLEREAETVKMYAKDAQKIVEEVQYLLNTEGATLESSQNWEIQNACKDWEKYLGLWFPGILYFHFK